MAYRFFFSFFFSRRSHPKDCGQAPFSLRKERGKKQRSKIEKIVYFFLCFLFLTVFTEHPSEASNTRQAIRIEGESKFLGRDETERLHRFLLGRGYYLSETTKDSTLSLVVSMDARLHFSWHRFQRSYQIPEQYQSSSARIRSILLYLQVFVDTFVEEERKGKVSRKERPPTKRRGEERPPKPTKRPPRSRKPPQRQIPTTRVALLPTTRIALLPTTRVALLPTTKPLLEKSEKAEEERKRQEEEARKREEEKKRRTAQILPPLKPPSPALTPEIAARLQGWWGTLSLGGVGAVGFLPTWGMGGRVGFQAGWGRWSVGAGMEAQGLVGGMEGSGLLLRPMLGVGFRFLERGVLGEIHLSALSEILRLQATGGEGIWQTRWGIDLGVLFALPLSSGFSFFLSPSFAFFPQGFRFLAGDLLFAEASQWQFRLVLGLRFDLFSKMEKNL
jgi:hypothetical protein